MWVVGILGDGGSSITVLHFSESFGSGDTRAKECSDWFLGIAKRQHDDVVQIPAEWRSEYGDRPRHREVLRVSGGTAVLPACLGPEEAKKRKPGWVPGMAPIRE